MGKHDWNWKPPVPEKRPAAGVSARPSVSSSAGAPWGEREELRAEFPRLCPMCQETRTRRVEGNVWECLDCRRTWRVVRLINHS